MNGSQPSAVEFSKLHSAEAATDNVPVRLLLIEDSAVDATFVRRMLERAEPDLFAVTWVASLAEALIQLREIDIEVILLDLNLNDSEELDSFLAISAIVPDTPIVVLTGTDALEKGFDTIRQGAQDYLVKGQINGRRLVRSLLFAIERKRLAVEEMQMAEQSLEETEGKYRQLFEYESDAVLVLDVASQFFEDVNQAAITLFGYSREEFAGVGPEELSYEKEKTRAHLVRALQGEPDSYRIPVRRFRKKDGQIFAGEIAVRTFVQSGSRKMITSIRDITHREKMEAAVRKSEARFRLLVEQVVDALFLIDLEGRILDVNQSACDSLGLTKEQLFARNISEIDDELTAARLAQLWLELDAGHPVTWEGAHRRHDGTMFPVELRVGRFLSEEHPLLLASVRDITQRKQEEAQRLFHAYHDVLTRLPNRTMFLQRLEEISVHAETAPFAVLFLDLDRFKKINDSLGHEAGDQLIIETAARLKKLLSAKDTLARLTADEFAMLYRLPSHEQAKAAVRAFVDQIREVMARPFVLRGQDAFCSVSMGIALSSTGYRHSQNILRDAEIAVHQAKAAGRGQAIIFDQAMREQAIRLHQVETDLRRAIERKEFVVYYQPIISLESGRITGFEALVRWNHPQHGLLSPHQFLDVAEDFGLIVPLGWQVMQAACAQVHAWNTQFAMHGPLEISVNCASLQFEQRDLVSLVSRVLQETGLAPQCLKLEITESALIENSTVVNATLEGLHSLGVRLVMDDFGTGYSSLSYLHQFPIEGLKIDRSFVGRMTPDDHNPEIVETIIALASALDLVVVAEGVESPSQLAHLRSLGCQFAQGYLISPPVTPDAAATLLQCWPQW